MKPLIGISCCSKEFGVFATPNHAASDTYVRAVDEVMGAVPVLIPANGAMADIATLLDRLDGIILTGSRSNVEPCHYRGPPHLCGTPEDARRDAVTLRLVRDAIGRRVPLLAICRGFQEMNVALGGTLHQRLQDLPGRIDHSTPLVGLEEVRHGKAHAVTVCAGGWLHRIAGAPSLAVNSLHNQGIDRLAPSLTVEAVAPDGTIEAFSDARSYAVGVQWHPEYDFGTDAVSKRIFEDFAAAVCRRGARPGVHGHPVLAAAD
jgi:putative glutamine amidotransferase